MMNIRPDGGTTNSTASPVAFECKASLLMPILVIRCCLSTTPEMTLVSKQRQPFVLMATGSGACGSVCGIIGRKGSAAYDTGLSDKMAVSVATLCVALAGAILGAHSIGGSVKSCSADGARLIYAVLGAIGGKARLACIPLGNTTHRTIDLLWSSGNKLFTACRALTGYLSHIPTITQTCKHVKYCAIAERRCAEAAMQGRLL
jgi:hypothetical protein